MLLAVAALIPPLAAAAPAAPADTLTAARAFAGLPLGVLDILDRSTRLDMLDYADADSVLDARNLLDGTSRLTLLTPTYARVELTDVSTLQIKVLPYGKNDHIVMALTTVGSPSQAADTGIDFFDSSLRPLDAAKLFREPRMADFFDIPRGSATTIKEIEGMIPFPTYEITATPDSDDVTLTLTAGPNMDVDDYNIMKLFLRPGVRWRWTGKRFEPARK